jgi:hypothetical protein
MERQQVASDKRGKMASPPAKNPAKPKRKEIRFEIEWDGLDRLLLAAIGILLVVVLATVWPDWRWHSLHWYWTRAVWYWHMQPWVRGIAPITLFGTLVVLVWIRALWQR